MKILLIFLITFFAGAASISAAFYFIDETPPSGLKAVSNTLYVAPNGGIWIDKGPVYGWNRIARYSDIGGAGISSTAIAGGVHKNDANGNLVWPNKIITATGNQIDKDSDTGAWVWNHPASGSASSTPATVTYDGFGNATVKNTSTGQTL